jgi:hypothetical protein
VRRRGLIAFGLLALAAGWARAQPRAAQTLRQGEVLRGRFRQERHLQGFRQPLVSEGGFLLAPGRGLIWRAETPFLVTTVVTPTGIVQRSRDAETMRLPVSRLPVLARLHALLDAALAGDWRALESEFKVAQLGDARDWRLTLTPLRPEAAEEGMQLRELRLAGARFVERIEIEKPNGDVDRLSLSGQEIAANPLGDDDRRLLDDASRP